MHNAGVTIYTVYASGLIDITLSKTWHTVKLYATLFGT